MIVVFGATGQVGRATVRELVARGAPVTAVTRDPVRAADLLPDQARLVAADLDEPSSVARAVDGATAVLVLSPHSPAQAEREGRIVEAARRSGVARLVKVSALPAAVRPDSSSLVGRLHYATETMIRRSGIPWTFVRPTPFQQNLPQCLDTAVRGNALLLPFGQARVAFVDAGDVGAVCAAALLEAGDACHVYAVTGPEALRMPDVARLLGGVVRHAPLRYRPVPPSVAACAQRRQGVSGWLADHQAALGRLIGDGEAVQVTTTVADVTGRPARRLADLLLAPVA